MKKHGNYTLPNEFDVLVALENGDVKFAETTIWRMKKKHHNDKRHIEKSRRYDTKRKKNAHKRVEKGN